jgi:3-phenylpropionate/cinnamic acid dioxygenase small subunit
MLSLEDERQISAVLIRYATGIDRKDWALFESCFTEDCRTEYSGAPAWTSARELTKVMEDAHVKFRHTLHRMSNIVIDGEGDRAQTRVYVDALLVPSDRDVPVTSARGYYEDEFVRTATGWRIAVRRFTFVDRFLRDTPPLELGEDDWFED